MSLTHLVTIGVLVVAICLFCSNVAHINHRIALRRRLRTACERGVAPEERNGWIMRVDPDTGEVHDGSDAPVRSLKYLTSSAGVPLLERVRARSTTGGWLDLEVEREGQLVVNAAYVKMLEGSDKKGGDDGGSRVVVVVGCEYV